MDVGGVALTSRCRSGYLHLRRQMLLDGVPPEAKLQPDLDVGAALGVELLSALEVIAGEASPATGRLRGLAAGSTDGGLSDTDLGSDLADRHARAGQIEDLLLLGHADRTAGRVADAAGRRGLAHLPSRRYASRARLQSHLTRDEALAEGEQGLPVVCVELAEAHHSIAIQTLTTSSRNVAVPSRDLCPPTVGRWTLVLSAPESRSRHEDRRPGQSRSALPRDEYWRTRWNPPGGGPLDLQAQPG